MYYLLADILVRISLRNEKKMQSLLAVTSTAMSTILTLTSVIVIVTFVSDVPLSALFLEFSYQNMAVII